MKATGLSSAPLLMGRSIPGVYDTSPIEWVRAEEPASVNTLLPNSVSELERLKLGHG